MPKEYSARELADILGGTLTGNPEIKVQRISDLRFADANSVVFLGHQRYEPLAQKTKAAVILLPPDYPHNYAQAQIRVADPYQAFTQVAALFMPPPRRHPTPGVHPTAIVAPSAQIHSTASIGAYVIIEENVVIGEDTIIEPHVYIGEGSHIGKQTHIYPQVVIREYTQIGDRVIVHSGAVIGADGFGYEFAEGRHKKIPQNGYVQIDDDVEIGANTTIDRGRFDRTWIQEGVKIDNLVQIAHNVIIGAHSIIVAQAGISGSTVLGRYVTIAGQAGIAGHLEIGDQATITAQSGVAKNVPPRATLAGRHALPLRESLKVEAAMRKLPEILQKIRSLEKRLAELKLHT
ncbi:MAG: UDP-3-O-(3-hydroxymyristoyl)glucosamine N-acyltransferase [Methylacidiphilales bacterium]|nr:UDP-3-O-(3-hydroxymyristoyl)glucosamine N-acyltransferase [Candidatus Methylacidiphilales bacterium]MDW8350180.1 UDP-3-O-(3-hydroxymyristoyl)glucosamine N-acyltransferase [Verrucomicrobiae bacterium]